MVPHDISSLRVLLTVAAEKLLASWKCRAWVGTWDRIPLPCYVSWLCRGRDSSFWSVTGIVTSLRSARRRLAPNNTIHEEMASS